MATWRVSYYLAKWVTDSCDWTTKTLDPTSLYLWEYKKKSVVT
jgi:hypothetical protein